MVEVVENNDVNAADVASPSKVDEKKVEEPIVETSNADENVEASAEKESEKVVESGGNSVEKAPEAAAEEVAKSAEEKKDDVDDMEGQELSEQPESFSPEHPEDSRVHEVDIEDEFNEDEADYDEDQADYDDDGQSEGGEVEGDVMVDGEAKDDVKLEEGEKLEEVKAEEVDVDKHTQEPNVPPKTDCKQFVYLERVPPSITMPYLRHVLKHDEHMTEEIVGWKDLEHFCIWLEAEDDELAEKLMKKLENRRFARSEDPGCAKAQTASIYVREEIEEERKKKLEENPKRKLTDRDFAKVWVPGKTRNEFDVGEKELKKIEGCDRWDPEWQGSKMMGKGKAKLFSRRMKHDGGRELQPKIDGGVEIFSSKSGGFRAIGRHGETVLLAPARAQYWMAVDDKDTWCEQISIHGLDGLKDTHDKLLVKPLPRPGTKYRIVLPDGTTKRTRTRGGRREREKREKMAARRRGERPSGRFEERRGGRGSKGGGKGGNRYDDYRRGPPLRRNSGREQPPRRSFDYRRDDRGHGHGGRSYGSANGRDRPSYGDRSSYASASGATRDNRDRGSYASASGRDRTRDQDRPSRISSSIKYYGSNRDNNNNNDKKEERKDHRRSDGHCDRGGGGSVGVLKNIDVHQEKELYSEKKQRELRKKREGDKKSKGSSDGKRSGRAEKRSSKEESRSSRKEKESKSSRKEKESSSKDKESRSSKKRSREEATEDKDRKSRRTSRSTKKREKSASIERPVKSPRKSRRNR